MLRKANKLFLKILIHGYIVKVKHIKLISCHLYVLFKRWVKTTEENGKLKWCNESAQLFKETNTKLRINTIRRSTRFNGNTSTRINILDHFHYLLNIDRWNYRDYSWKCEKSSFHLIFSYFFCSDFPSVSSKDRLHPDCSYLFPNDWLIGT